MSFGVIFLIFLMGGGVIALAGMFLLKTRKFEDEDHILPEQLHFLYNYYLQKMKEILK